MKSILVIMSLLLITIFSGCSQDKPSVPKVEMKGKNSITTSIKEKLDSTKELQGTSIYPHIDDGKTLLSGIVHTQKQKFLASTIARSVEGSGIVVNRLVIN